MSSDRSVMSGKTYDRITTLMILSCAAMAVLSDNYPHYLWIFGSIAIACAAVSAWMYFRHGMRKCREK
jgi:hypothetical protein